MNVTTIADRKQVVRESELEVWNEGHVNALDDVCTDAYVLHTSMGDQNLGEVKAMVKSVRSGTSDFEFRIDDLFGENDRVALRYTMGGTNTGPSFLTEEPTGETWVGSGISIYRFEEGTMAEQWDNFDFLGVMRQLGTLPADPTPVQD